MKKLSKFIGLSLAACVVLSVMTLAADKLTLRNGLVRLHVVAASDTDADQAVKLWVRDAVLDAVAKLEQPKDADQAKKILGENLEQLEHAANKALREAGSSDIAMVTLHREEFPVRHYDTFSLPAGVYESLRVTIGEGNGRNWWCVVFPALCFDAVSEETVQAGGFSEGLYRTVSRRRGYEVRFFFLDLLGKAENFFHFS